MAHLLERTPAGAEKRIDLPVAPSVVVGRSSSRCGAVVSGLAVSSTHCEILRTPEGGFAVRDLSSSNGTFVNGTKVEGTVPLYRGDTLRMADHPVRIFGDDVPARPAPPAPPKTASNLPQWIAIAAVSGLILVALAVLYLRDGGL